MTSEARRMLFLVAGAATLLVLVGILYVSGTVIVMGAHDQRAAACFAAAVASAIAAYSLCSLSSRI